IKTAYELKEKFSDGVWKNGIKFDIHSDIVIGSVSVTAFIDSINPIIDRYMKEHPFKKKDGFLQIEYAKRASIKIAKLLNETWSRNIQSKWAICFNEEFVLDENGESIKKYYDNNFYIQKTIGVKALNSILSDIVKKNGFENSVSIK